MNHPEYWRAQCAAVLAAAVAGVGAQLRMSILHMFSSYEIFSYKDKDHSFSSVCYLSYVCYANVNGEIG